MSYGFNSLHDAHAIQSKDRWDLLLWAYEENWAFNLLKYFIINEQFLNGTEKALDWWYFNGSGRSTKSHRSYLRASFSREEFEGWETTWEFIKDDENDSAAGFYIDTKTGHKLWLCALWAEMWGGKAEKLYCSFKAEDMD